MVTHPYNPTIDPHDYMSPYWSLGSMLDSNPYGGYPVSGDDLARWRKALAS